MEEAGNKPGARSIRVELFTPDLVRYPWIIQPIPPTFQSELKPG